MELEKTTVLEKEISENSEKGNDNKIGKRFMFTIFNYTDDDINHLKAIAEDGTTTSGVWYGLETCPTTGKLHIQGYVTRDISTSCQNMNQKLHHEFAAWKKQVDDSPKGPNKLKIKDFKFRINYCKLAVMKHETCICYCFKGEQSHIEWEEKGTNGPNYGLRAQTFGELPDSQKKKPGNKYIDAYNCIQENNSLDVVIGQNPEMFIKHAANIDRLVNMALHKKRNDGWLAIFEKMGMRPWQQALIDDITVPVNFYEEKANMILWIYDTRGGNGKTFISSYLQFKYGAIRFPGSTNKADVLNRYNGETIILFDIERATTLDKFDFSTLEAIMSPVTYSGKYQGKNIYKPEGLGARICIFANVPPILNKVSFARWDIRELHNGILKNIKPSDIAGPSTPYKLPDIQFN